MLRFLHKPFAGKKYCRSFWSNLARSSSEIKDTLLSSAKVDETFLKTYGQLPLEGEVE